MDDLCSAMEIFCGTWVDVSQIEIPDTKTPEDFLMEKDIYRKLSNEARYLFSIITSLPDEFYSERMDRVSWQKIYAFCRKNKSWKKRKVDRLKDEIYKKLRSQL